MYIRSKIQERTLENLDTLTQELFPNSRVTRGHILSELLENYTIYTNNEYFEKAIKISDIKQGPGIAINFNITLLANQKLNTLKAEVDKKTGRSMFPAQIIDILLICAKEYFYYKKDFDDVPFNIEQIDTLRLAIINDIISLDYDMLKQVYKYLKKR